MAGTTILDTGQVPEAFRTVLGDHGIPVTTEDCAPSAVLRSAGLPESSSSVNSRAEKQRSPGAQKKIFEAFRKHLSRKYREEGVQLIPGTLETFSRLQANGAKIALNTGFDRLLTDLLLDAVAFAPGRVSAVVCGDDVSEGRPAPYLIFRAMEAAGAQSVHRVASVGDTTLDLQAGYHAGVRWNIGVLSGAHTKEQMEKVPHTHLIPSVAVLPDLWK